MAIISLAISSSRGQVLPLYVVPYCVVRVYRVTVIRMTKQYNLHSVRIEDEVWARVKSSGISVNQLLRKALELTWTETRRVVSGDGDEVMRNTVTRSTVVPHPGRAPLLKPSQR